MALLRRLIYTALLWLVAVPAFPYSVLSHEAIVDSLWNRAFLPSLLARFPDSTPEQLAKARAYAYGGCIIQDMGYYPFGSKFFSDLTHYVRSGDFVLALLYDAKDANEYAFALGALAHYAGDNEGHPLATNKTVPIAYPNLGRKFGPSVTYEDNPLAHLRTEFAFDVVQVMHQHYAPADYHNFIGFEVSRDLLERAFRETYSIEITKVFSNLDLTIGTYRWSVRSVIPTMTKAAWATNKDEIVSTGTGVTRRRFLYNLKRADFEKEWGHNYEHPGIWAKILAFFLRFIPKIGPFRALAMPKLTPEAQNYFMASFNSTITRAQDLMQKLRDGTLTLPNENFDTGEPAAPGTYTLADSTYVKLIGLAAAAHYAGVSPELRKNILVYCADPAKFNSRKWKAQDRQRLDNEITALRNLAILP